MTKRRFVIPLRKPLVFFPGLTMIFLLLAVASKGQSVVAYYDYNWKPSTEEAARFISEVKSTDSGFVRHDFYVQERSMQMAGLYQDAECKKPHGQFYYYHANKKLESLGKYKNGKKDGLWMRFHSNGMMLDSAHYENGNPIGTYKSWWPNGMPHDSIVYHPDGTAVHAISSWQVCDEKYAGRKMEVLPQQRTNQRCGDLPQWFANGKNPL
jgi:antitoxin component YwqK of YwqJK toxin-antitoxin module